MFTNRIASYYSPGKVLIEAACLSSDTKPTTGVANGSKCIEMDTGKTYMFNEEGSEWEELPSSGGGGGGGGGSSDFSTATVTLINTDTSTQYFFRADSIQNDGIKETTVSVAEPVDVEIPLYKGNHTITIMSIASNDMDVLPTGAGGVTVDMPTMSIIITGDGTLTAKGIPTS